MEMKDDNRLKAAMEVTTQGIAVELPWSLIHQLVFYAVLLAGVFLLALDGELVSTVLEQLVIAAFLAYLGKGGFS